MRASSFASRSLFSLALVSLGACATAGGPNTSRVSAKSRQAETIQYWRQLQDSVTAQAIADEQGPRVSLRAEFTSYGGGRRVEAFFNVKDDAYIFIGHLDANGVVKVLFPESPDDDGFVRGGKSYHTTPKFAGFETDYSWRRANYYTQISTSAARLDSYDYGTGYMFIVASWRPMRLDRVSEAGRWSTFQLASDELIADPRPAVGELASLLAGDNRESYTLEFAKYYRTNLSQSGYAASSFSSLDCAFGYSSEAALFYPWLRTAYIPVYGYNPFGFNPFASYQYSTVGLGSRCGGYGGYYGGLYAYTPFVPRTQAPPITPPIQRPTPNIQLALPRWMTPNAQLPNTPSPAPAGERGAPSIPAAPRLRATDDLLTPRDAHTSNGYRERGLITDEDGASPNTSAPRLAGESQRPSIVDMVGRRREEMGGTGVNGRTQQYGQPRNSRESIDVPRDSYRPHNDGSSYPGAGVSSPRGGETRQFNPSHSAPHEAPSRPSSGGSSGGGTETRSSPPPVSAPRIEHPSSPPVTSPRPEPAARPAEPSKPNPKG